MGLPGLAKHVPWSAERWLAKLLSPTPSQHDRCGTTIPETAELLQRMVRRIYPLDAADAAMPITVDVLRGDTVNAFASLGGKIYIYDGLLRDARSPEELAGILAHEIEHVKNRHVIQGAAASMFTLGALHSVWPGGGQGGGAVAHWLLTLTFSRGQEAEADEKGLERLRAAGVDAAGLREFFLRTQSTQSGTWLLSSHPDDGSRAERASRFRGYPTTPIMGAADWAKLKSICH